MMRIHTLRNKLRPLLRPKIVVLALLVLITAAVLVYWLANRQYPTHLWLPNTALYSAKDDSSVYDLPVSSKKTNTEYGPAIVFSTHPTWQTIYQFRASDRLRPSECPNIGKIKALAPSDCKKIGKLQGNDLYAMHRSLPSGMTEYFVTMGDTFLVVHGSGDGGERLDYLQSFKRVNQWGVGPYLSANKKIINGIQARQAAQEAKQKRESANAYTYLDFAPALPSVIPAGWAPSDKLPLFIDGPDATHPRMVSTEYSKSKSEYINVYVIKLAEGRATDTCGPTPGQGMQYLPCFTVPGTSMYEHITYGNTGDLFRYVYYPVGDSLVISFATARAKDGITPPWPTDLVAVQDALTSSAKPVSQKDLKNSKYYKLFYDRGITGAFAATAHLAYAISYKYMEVGSHVY